jgi:hypothetical protein
MRPRQRIIGPAWRVNLGSADLPAAPALVQCSALDLSGEQKFALVFLRKAARPRTAAKIIEHLNEAGIPFPTQLHWRELRREGYVTLEPNGHRLTPKGNGAAAAIMTDLARKYSVHVFDREGGRGTGRGMITRCSCGSFSAGPHMNTRGGESRITSAEIAHHRDVESGAWEKQRQRLTEFSNFYAPPQFPFSGPPQSTPNSTSAAGPESPGAVVASVSATAPGMN